MLRDEKWLNYAIQILKVCDSGVSTAHEVTEEVDGSASYTTKVVSSLRKAGLIDKEYQLSKPLDELTIKEVLEASGTYLIDNTPIGKITKIMLDALEKPLTDIL